MYSVPNKIHKNHVVFNVSHFFTEKRSTHTFREMVFHRNGSINSDYIAFPRGIYHIHYKRFLKFFPKEQILVLNGELFAKDPFPILKEVETFLVLKPFIERKHVVWNEKKNFNCMKPQSKVICLGRNKGRKHPFIANNTLAAIRNYYRPHNRMFEKMVNQTFSWA